MSFPVKAPFLFILFCLFTTTLSAQKKGWQDVVYLKNGSIIRGDLLSDTLSGQVKIETLGRNTWVFTRAEVLRLTREPIRPDFKYPFQKGYLNQTELGLSVGNSARANERRPKDFTLQTFNGYQFVPPFALGLTTGIDTYGYLTLLPVGLGLRGDLAQTKNRHFYALDAGYALTWLNNPNQSGEQKGGWFWSPALGIKFNSRQTHAFLLSLGYRQQITRLNRSDLNISIVDRSVYRRVLFRLGISF